jgi:hypothetical protein
MVVLMALMTVVLMGTIRQLSVDGHTGDNSGPDDYDGCGGGQR